MWNCLRFAWLKSLWLAQEINHGRHVGTARLRVQWAELSKALVVKVCVSVCLRVHAQPSGEAVLRPRSCRVWAVRTLRGHILCLRRWAQLSQPWGKGYWSTDNTEGTTHTPLLMAFFSLTLTQQLPCKLPHTVLSFYPLIYDSSATPQEHRRSHIHSYVQSHSL